MNNLKNKKIILTGGSRGIGLSILKEFYDNGVKSIINENYYQLLIKRGKLGEVKIKNYLLHLLFSRL